MEKKNNHRKTTSRLFKKIINLAPKIFLGLMMIGITVAPSSAEVTMGPERTISNQDFHEYFPQAAYNSIHDELLVVWHDVSPLQSRSIMGKRVDSQGNTISEFIIEFDAVRDNAQPTVSYDVSHDRYLVSWVRDFSGDGTDWDVYGRIIPWQGPTGAFPSFAIATPSSKQWSPRAVYGVPAGEFLVTWWTEGSGGVNSYISAQRVGADGSLLGGNLAVSSGPEERTSPDVAYNVARNEYLIVFQQANVGGWDVQGVRIGGAGGGILGGGDFVVAGWSDWESAPRVAGSFDNGDWAVAWHSDLPAGHKDIYVRRLWVNGGGFVEMAAPVHVRSTVGDDQYPDIEARPNSSEFLVAWEEPYTNGLFGIEARTIDTSNSLGPLFSVRPVYGGQIGDSSRPDIAAAPNGWFAVWEQGRDANPSHQDIHGRAIFGALFSDGFESGDLSAWSDSNP